MSNARRRFYLWASTGFVSIVGQSIVTHAQWLGYAGNDQHTALATTESQPLAGVKWSTPVDMQPQFINGDVLLIHYGSPSITANNTVLVPVKTGAQDGFKIQAFDGANGTLKWTQATDYTLPPKTAGWPGYTWTPSYGPTLSPTGNLYYAGAGGTIYMLSGLDAAAPATPTQLAFYGIDNYLANSSAFNGNISISTPITADSQGDIYFGYETSGAVIAGFNGNQPLTNGVARISPDGSGTFFQAKDLLLPNGGAAGMSQVAMNAAPAVSNDGQSIYVAMSTGNFGAGRLVELNSTSLVQMASTALIDPKSGANAQMPNISTASPLVGPDGDVYMGVYDTGNTSRGWMLHFSGNLTVQKASGGFGWDDTASIVPAAMVPSYHGSSSYLLMTKYNNYRETGGDGINMIAILDPNETELDPRFHGTGISIMKQILTIPGPTLEEDSTTAVREWCINTAVVDPATDSILVNNEDGTLYRWDLRTNTLTQATPLTGGFGEAYTPTLEGPDGTVYAINGAQLFAVGVNTFIAQWDQGNGNWSDVNHWNGGPVPNNGLPATAWYNVIIGGGQVTLDADQAIHALTLANATLSGLANLTLSSGTIDGTYDVMGLTTVSGTLQFNGVSHHAGAFTGTGNIVVSPGVTLVSDNVNVRSLTVNGTHAIRSNGGGGSGNGVSWVTSLTIGGSMGNWTGRLDIADNSLIVEPEGSEAKAAAILSLQDQIRSGTDHGAYDGPGITSSTVVGGDRTQLVLADNADLAMSTYRGLSVDNNSLIVVQAHDGDANLDGSVDSLDLSLLANHWQQSGGALWSAGDFNDDGKVDSLDLTTIANNWQFHSPTDLAAAFSAFSGGSSPAAPVPEPSSLFLLAATIPLLARRKQSRLCSRF